MKNKLIIFSLILFSIVLTQPALSLSVIHSPESSDVSFYTGNLTNLSELADVSSVGWTDGESLTYNSATGMWESTAIGGLSWVNIVNGTMLSQADWNTNYTANDAAWRLDTDTFAGNYTNFTTVYNYATNSTGISWTDAVNGTLFSQIDWNINYTANDADWRSITNTSYYLATNPFAFYNSTNPQTETDPFWNGNYSNFTTVYNYATNSTGISWSDAINGTLLSQADWDANYTANDAAWRLDTDTFKNNYSAFLALPTLSEILAFNYYNSTDFSIGDYYLKSNPFGYYNSTNPQSIINSSYYLATNPFGFYNITTAPIYINDTFAANYSDFLTHISWANAINGTLFSQADWNTNYTANDAAWRLDTDTFVANYSDFLTHTDWATVYNGTLAKTDSTNSFGNFNQTFDTNTLFIDSVSGRVGIGTAEPQNKLDVAGGFVVGSSLAGVNTAPTDGALIEGDLGSSIIRVLKGWFSSLDVSGDLNVTGDSTLSGNVSIGNCLVFDSGGQICSGS